MTIALAKKIYTELQKVQHYRINITIQELMQMQEIPYKSDMLIANSDYQTYALQVEKIIILACLFPNGQCAVKTIEW